MTSVVSYENHSYVHFYIDPSNKLLSRLTQSQSPNTARLFLWLFIGTKPFLQLSFFPAPFPSVPLSTPSAALTMVIIAIAAVKGAAVVYKKAKQDEARQAIITPLLSSDDNFSNHNPSSAAPQLPLPPRSDSIAGCRPSNFDGGTSARFADEARAARRALAEDEERARDAEERAREVEERARDPEERARDAEGEAEKDTKTDAGRKSGADGSLRRRATTGAMRDDGSFNSFTTTTASARRCKAPSGDSVALAPNAGGAPRPPKAACGAGVTRSLEGLAPLSRNSSADAASRPPKAAWSAGAARSVDGVAPLARKGASGRRPKPAGDDGSFNSACRARRASADAGGAKTGERADAAAGASVDAKAGARAVSGEDGSFNSLRRTRSALPALVAGHGDERGGRPPPRAPSGAPSRAVQRGSFNAAMGMK